MDIVVKAVETRSERKQFLELPWSLYRNDPLWVPPLRQNQKEMLNYVRSPFYETAEIQTFLALRGGAPVGRVAAILNHAHNTFQKERRGFFGFFESIDNSEVAGGLLGAVKDWFTQRDIHQLRGPTNPSLNHECGLLIEGFQRPPTFMMTYNPPYYARLIEEFGFRKTQDLFAYWGPTEMVYNLDKKLMFIADEATKRFNIHLRPLNKSRFVQEIQMFLELYNVSLAPTWGFVPLSAHEIRHASASLKHLIIPDLAVVAEVEGKPIGAVFGLPDYNPRIKEIDGRLLPFGFLKLLNKKRGFQRFRVVSANVVPEYQHWGIGLVLLRGLVPKILSSGLKEAEFSWVLESNNLSRSSLEKGGAMREKVYRLYDYPVPAGA